MNIWHDISPKRIRKDRFYAVIEIQKGGKNGTQTGQGDRYAQAGPGVSPLLTIRPTTALSPAPTPATRTRWMCWYCAASKFSP